VIKENKKFTEGEELKIIESKFLGKFMTITTFLGSQFPSASNVSSILFRKLFWPTWIFKSFLHHQNFFFLTVVQNNFLNKIPILHGKNLKAFLGLKFPDVGNSWCYGLTRFKIFLAFTQTIVNFPTACSLDSDFCCPVPISFLICPNPCCKNKSILCCFLDITPFKGWLKNKFSCTALFTIGIWAKPIVIVNNASMNSRS